MRDAVPQRAKDRYAWRSLTLAMGFLMSSTPRTTRSNDRTISLRCSSALLAVGLLCLIGSQPLLAQLTPQDKADLQAVEASALASLSAHDVATFVGLFADDAVLQPPNAPTVRGHAELETWARAFPTVVSIAWPNAQWHGQGNLAWVTTDYILQVEGLPADRGKQMGVYRRSPNGTWQIAAVSFNSDLPVPAVVTAGNKVAFETLMSVWNTKEYDKLDAVLAPDFRRTGPDQNTESLAELKTFMRQVHTAYPDFHIVSDEVGYKGDVGFRKWTVTGTYSENGRKIEIPGMTLVRFKNGKMTGEWAHFDTATLQAQLEVDAVPHAR